VVNKNNNLKDIVIKFRIHQGYNIYAFVADKDPYIVTDVKIDLPDGYQKTNSLEMPSFRYYSNSGTTIYTDEVMFKQEIKGSGEGMATCTVSYQCCDSHICFPPVYDKIVNVHLK
jgi:hypothetical protein